jgi:hypothetical protein
MLPPASDPQLAFKEIARRIGSLLRSKGFKGSGQKFYRAITGTDEVWQTFSLQRTQWRVSPTDPVNFTANIYLYFPKLDQEALERMLECRVDRPNNRTPKSFGYGDLQLRVGDLLPPDRHDVWWDVDAELLEPLWSTLDPLFHQSILPALDDLGSRVGLAKLMHRLPWMSWPATLVWLGSLAPSPWIVRKDACGLPLPRPSDDELRTHGFLMEEDLRKFAQCEDETTFLTIREQISSQAKSRLGLDSLSPPPMT